MSGKNIAVSIAFLTQLAALGLAQNGPAPRPAPAPPPTQTPTAAPAAATINGATPIQGLTQAELAFFTEGVKRFTEIDSVSGTQPGATGVGLGPRFNLNSCAGCHANPSIGGSSPAVNPQIAVGTSYGPPIDTRRS